MFAFRLVFVSIVDRRGITRPLLWKSAALARSPIEILQLKRSRRRTSAWKVKKGGLANSLAALRLSLAEKEQEKEALRADLAKARDAEVLSAEQACRADELAEGLQRELASEKESTAAVGEQLSLTTRRLDSVKGVLAATIGHYRATVAEFGGETSAPPE